LALEIYLHKCYLELVETFPAKMHLFPNKLAPLSVFSYTLFFYLVWTQLPRQGTSWERLITISEHIQHGLAADSLGKGEFVQMCRLNCLVASVISAYALKRPDLALTYVHSLEQELSKLDVSKSRENPQDLIEELQGHLNLEKEGKSLNHLEIFTSPTWMQQQLENLLDSMIPFPPGADSPEGVKEFVLDDHFDVSTCYSSKPATEVLDALQEAYDDEGWFRQGYIHYCMALKALLKDQFNEADSHLLSLYNLAEFGSAPPAFLKALCGCRSRVWMTHLAYMCRLTILPTKYFDRGIPMGFARKLDYTLHTSSIDEGFWGSQALIWPSKPIANIKISKWWQWWEWFLEDQGQDKSLVIHLRANPGRYGTEARLMEETFIYTGHNQFGDALKTLDQLELACNNGLFIQYPVRSSPLQHTRCCFELAFEQIKLQKQLTECRFESFSVNGYRDLATQMEDLMPKCCNWMTPTMVEGYWYAAERLDLFRYQIRMRDEAKFWDENVLKNTYHEFLSLIENGYFARLNLVDIHTVRIRTLKLMLDRAQAAAQWKQAISLCDEYLALTGDTVEDLPRVLDDCVATKHACEWQLVNEDLRKAEDDLDFDKCTTLLERKWYIAERQKQTRGTVFFLFGSQLYKFQQEVYRDQCVGCVRWIRQKESPGENQEKVPAGAWCRILHKAFRFIIFQNKIRPRKIGKNRQKVVGVGNIQRRQRDCSSVSQRSRRRVFKLPMPLDDACEDGHDRLQFERPFGCHCHGNSGYCFTDR
jgi:hypothetical protein